MPPDVMRLLLRHPAYGWQAIVTVTVEAAGPATIGFGDSAVVTVPLATPEAQTVEGTSTELTVTVVVPAGTANVPAEVRVATVVAPCVKTMLAA